MAIQTFDPDDLLLPAVMAVLEALEAAGRTIPGSDSSNFAFNVLLNALCSTLEEIRACEPEQYRKYLEMAVLILRGE